MSRFLMYPVVLLIFLTSCAGHYYRVKNDIVRFYLDLPNAENVMFFSSLDGYKGHKVMKNSDETWEIEVPANYEFRYFFIVDGNQFLPACELKEVDDFGSANCVFAAEM